MQSVTSFIDILTNLAKTILLIMTFEPVSLKNRKQFLCLTTLNELRVLFTRISGNPKSKTIDS